MPDRREIGCLLCGYTTDTIDRYWGTCPNGCPTGEIPPELYGVHVRDGAVQLHATDGEVRERAAQVREMARR